MRTHPRRIPRLADGVAIPVVACLRVWLLDYLETRRMLKVEPATTVEPAKD